MGLKLLGLWSLVLCLSSVANADSLQNCLPPNIQHGFFISENKSLSHDTDLYYGCDENYKPIEGSWWGTVTCQNGTWSSSPQCIDDTACFYPEVPNSNFDKFQYKENNGKIWIKCNPGYNIKGVRATAICENGIWTTLPECEEMETNCKEPPKVPNAVIVGQDYQDVFPDETKVTYSCQSGFELKSNIDTIVCSNAQWIEPFPSCRQKDNIRSPGRVPSGRNASPGNSNSNNEYLFSPVRQCPDPHVVNNAVFYQQSPTSLYYVCNYLYQLTGSSTVRCLAGEWTTPPTCEVNFCNLDTSIYKHLEPIKDYIMSETLLKVDCPHDWKRSARAKCENRQLYLSECCMPLSHALGRCPYIHITSSQ